MQKTTIRNIAQNAFDSCFNNIENRKLVLHTGIQGMDLFNKKMIIINAIDSLDWFLNKKKITEKQYVNLTDMLNANDEESVNLALLLIKEL